LEKRAIYISFETKKTKKGFKNLCVFLNKVEQILQEHNAKLSKQKLNTIFYRVKKLFRREKNTTNRKTTHHLKYFDEI
jgi:hypothetical protein